MPNIGIGASKKGNFKGELVWLRRQPGDNKIKKKKKGGIDG